MPSANGLSVEVTPAVVLKTVPLSVIEVAEPKDATVAPNKALFVVMALTVGVETVGGAETVRLKLSIPMACAFVLPANPVDIHLK